MFQIYRALSIIIVALKLFEGQDLSTSLSLFNFSIFKKLAFCMDLIKQEAYNLRLIDMAMVRIYLNQRLNESHTLICDSLAINRLKNLDEVVPIND